ncbi:MAG: asparagine synthetase B family protein [Bosea sp. (in: a-proteobacteria)]
MCGLAVIIHRNPQPGDARLLEAKLKKALALMAHRGPDASGVAVQPVQCRNGGELAVIGLAHARLAILDLDPRSDQPFACDGHLLAYNGEIYNFRTLTQMMERKTEGDTEALLWLLRRHGTAALAEANGMWAFCWLDPDRRVLTAARDRYGKKPLFYCIDSNRMAFASEPAALMALWGARPVAEADSLDSFVSEGWLLPAADGSTFLKGVREVRPGHAIELDLDSWTVSEENVTPLRIDVGTRAADHPLADHALADLPLADLLADAVKARLLSDRKVALLLSGGVDSSLILSILSAKGWLDEVVCVVGEAGKSEDARYARACLDQLGVTGLELAIDYGGASVEHFLDVCAHQAKPFPLIGNVLGMAGLYRAAAAEGVRVALDGTGADEIFGGYWQRQAGFAMRDAARAGDTAWLARVREGGMLPAELRGLDNETLCKAALPTPARDLLGPDDLALVLPERRDGVRQAHSSDPLTGFEGSFPEALALDATGGRMQEWLWQNDRNAMAAGVENRSPFLDWRLAQHLRGSGASKFDGAFNKIALRALFASFTPLPTAVRQEKQGFRWVYGRFLRQNAPELMSLLAGSRLVSHYAAPDDVARLMADPEKTGHSKLLQRLIVLAGLEARGQLAAE